MRQFTIYALIVLPIFLYSITYYNIDSGDCLGVLMGITIWIIAEYGFHRFAFHNSNLSPKTYKILAYNHANHHDDPNNSANLYLPLRLTVPIAIMLSATAFILLGLPFATFLLIGMFAGLTAYEFVHYQAHHKCYNIWPLNYLTRRHLQHHYEHKDRMFGVTSPLMDWIMGTK